MGTILTLIRLKTEGKAVKGVILYHDEKILVHNIATLENADYTIPVGNYLLDVNWSPRFKKNLPIVVGVPGRTGIRIHTGTKPEHSTGCILVKPDARDEIIALVNKNRENYEKVILSIVDVRCSLDWRL